MNYAFTHDLKAPLRAILGFSQRLGAHPKNSQEQSHLKAILSAAEQLQDSLDGLAHYVALCQRPPQLQPIELEPLLDSICRELSPTGKIQRSRDLPVVLGEPLSLTTIFRQLLKNGLLYHLPEQSADLKIGWQERGAQVEVWVRDQGLGIAPEHHQLIFHAFQRLHSQEDYPGVGLGLTLAGRAALVSNAKLSVQSQLGQGSTFTLVLDKAGD